MLPTRKTWFQLQASFIAGGAVLIPLARFLARHGIDPDWAWLGLAITWVVVFRWMRRRWPVTSADVARLPSLQQAVSVGRHEALFEVRIADGRLVLWHPVEDEIAVPLADVDAVAIETDASGPFASDVRWLLRAADRTIVIPLGATGEDVLLDWVQSLPGVDNEAIIAAMGSTTIGRFPVWTRGAAQSRQPS